MKLKNLSFPEAVEEIAQNAGLTVEYDTTNTRSKEEVDLQKEYYDLMDRCATLYTQVLNSPEGAPGLEYFQKSWFDTRYYLKVSLRFCS